MAIRLYASSPAARRPRRARPVVVRMALAVGWVAGMAGVVACSSASPTGAGNDSETPPGSSMTTSPNQNEQAPGLDASVADGARGNSTAGDAASTSALGDSSIPSEDGSAASSDGAGGSATGGDSSTAASLVYPAYAGDNGTVAEGIAQLNLYRSLVGLSQVTLDSASSAACATHLQYLVCAQATMGMGYLEHTETGVPSCATDGGEPAGIDSDLAWGQGSTNGKVTDQSMGQAVDLWINGLYHRNPLLNPGLTKVGAASTDGYNCLDYNAPGNTVSERASSPVLLPPDGTTDVPETFGGFESPCPTAADPLTATNCGGSGFIVTANWYGWVNGNSPHAITAVSSVTMTDTTTNAAVPLFAWYADTISGHDPAPGYVQNEIALVPQASLAANTTFSVAISATISGQATNLSWSFTTGSRVAPSL